MNKIKIGLSLIAVLATVLLAVGGVGTADAAVPPIPDRIAPCGTLGDLNKDGNIGWKDAQRITIHLGAVRLLNERQMERADVNKDGSVTYQDVILIWEYLGGEIDTFPGCTTIEVALQYTSIVGLVAPSGQQTPQEADARIRFNVTAIGGDVYIRDVVSAATGGVEFISTFTSNAEMGQNGDLLFLVRSGETRWFEVNGHLKNIGEKPVFSQMVVSELQWSTSPNKSPTVREVDFQTAEIFLFPPS